MAATKAASATKKKTTAKKTSAKKPAAKTAAKKTTSTGSSLKLTATEKKLVELYRAASTTTKKEAMEVLKNDSKPNDSLLEAVLSNKEVKKVFTDMIKSGLKT
ncbi:MAG: hypothetical protein K5931_07655 [Lachnospiraceae bacterium]|nr:hypothetical protein [Lachnospiraceae bacterium]